MVDESPKDKSSERSSDSASEGQPRLAEALKKVLTAGVSAAFMTEESLRSYLSELKLPKDLLLSLITGAAKTKDEIAARVTNEAVSMLRKIDFVKEFSRFAEDHKFRVSAEIEIVKRDKHAEKQDHKSGGQPGGQ